MGYPIVDLKLYVQLKEHHFPRSFIDLLIDMEKYTAMSVVTHIVYFTRVLHLS
jgi:hypothetical protein